MVTLVVELGTGIGFQLSGGVQSVEVLPTQLAVLATTITTDIWGLGLVFDCRYPAHCQYFSLSPMVTNKVSARQIGKFETKTGYVLRSGIFPV